MLAGLKIDSGCLNRRVGGGRRARGWRSMRRDGGLLHGEPECLRRGRHRPAGGAAAAPACARQVLAPAVACSGAQRLAGMRGEGTCMLVRGIYIPSRVNKSSMVAAETVCMTRV